MEHLATTLAFLSGISTFVFLATLGWKVDDNLENPPSNKFMWIWLILTIVGCLVSAILFDVTL